MDVRRLFIWSCAMLLLLGGQTVAQAQQESFYQGKTIKVVVAYQTKHPKYGKYLKRRTVLHAHDEKNEAREGDRVEIAECRPLSRTKHHRLLRIVEKAPERAVQVSAEEVMTGKAPEAD